MEGTTPSYLRTHPVTYERIAEAQARADTLPYRQVPDSPDFQMVRALLRSYQGEPHEAVTFFVDALADRKFNDENAVRYGLVAAYLRAKEYAKAKQGLALLEKKAPQHPMIEAIAAHVLLESGDTQVAIVRLERALQRYPNKLQLVYDYPEALVKAQRYADAAKFCEEQLTRFAGNGQLHRIAARAYAGLGRKLKHHYHQAEYYAWLGNLRGAMDQLQLASRAGDANFYEVSVVETRLRALRREIAEQQKEGFGREG
jgi:predicted Zn-dependent protease